MKKYEDFETFKDEYVKKIAEQLDKYPRYTASINNDAVTGNDPEEIIQELKAKVPMEGKVVVRISDLLRRLDQSRVHVWQKWEEDNIRAWMTEATIESGAKEKFRMDCVEDQRATEAQKQ